MNGSNLNYAPRFGEWKMTEVGTARCAVRAAYQRRNVGRDSPSGRNLFRPLLRGRGHRSAMSLPQQDHPTTIPAAAASPSSILPASST
jgi:hypothetical protein